jgi:DnaJ-class molecular chaperone
MDYTEEEKNYYDILGVPYDATDHNIKAQFHKLARLYHPDKQKSRFFDETKFIQIQEAWKILSNSESKRSYDESIRANIQAYQAMYMNADDVGIDEFVIDKEGVRSRTCRCGDYFQVCELQMLPNIRLTVCIILVHR